LIGAVGDGEGGRRRVQVEISQEEARMICRLTHNVHTTACRVVSNDRCVVTGDLASGISSQPVPVPMPAHHVSANRGAGGSRRSLAVIPIPGGPAIAHAGTASCSSSISSASLRTVEPFGCACRLTRSITARRKRSRARKSVDMTVPIGTPTTSAISL
jgi:hypothetical protein